MCGVTSVSCRLDLLVALTQGGRDIQYFEEAIGQLLWPLCPFTQLPLSPFRLLPSRVDAGGN